MASVYKGRVGNMRQAKGRTSNRTRVAEKSYTMHGGPWHGHKVALAEPSTVPINVQGWRGRYQDNHKGGLTWIDL